MAFETGTATDYADFYNRLIAFLTTDSDLVASSQNWAQVWQPDSNSAGDADGGFDVVLRGPGLTASDQVYVGLRLVPDVLNDNASIQMVGMTGIIASAQNFDDHINVSPKVQMFTRGNNAMDYWFVANGRRFIAIAQVSTVYEGLYGGLFLPYGDPTQYSYPLFIGGTAGFGGTNGGNGAGEPADWRDTGTFHSLFHRPEIETSGSGNAASSANLLDPSGNWLTVAITDNETYDVSLTPWEFFDANSATWNFDRTSLTSVIGYGDTTARVIQSFGDDFILNPIGMLQGPPNSVSFGVLQGVYHVAGRGNSAENVINADGKDHIAFPNVFRTGIDQFFAIELGFPENSNSLS